MHASSKYDPASVKVQLLVAGGDVPCIPGSMCLEMKNMHTGSKYDDDLASVKVPLLVVAGGAVPCIPGSM